MRERKVYGGNGDDRLTLIDTRHIAEVAFTALTHPVLHINKGYVLTGGKAYGYSEIAQALSDAIKKEAAFVPDAPSWYRSPFLNLSYNKPFITETAEEVPGRPPRTVEQFFKDYAHLFK